MAERERVKARLHVEQSLAVATLGLDAARAHYLRHVLRLERGDRIAVFNGRDGEMAARIDGFGKGWCTLSLEEKRRDVTPEPDLWLVFAPIKRARLDFLAEKATELGVAALWPVFTQRTIVSRVNTERLLATCVEAAEQSERLTVPTIHAPAALEAVLARWPSGRRILMCDETGGGAPLADVLARQGTDGPHAVLTGPEGGFARGELDALRKLPFVTPIGLGPRVLRADTAALAALAAFLALSGDRLRSPPPRAHAS
ncbi:MAG: 16S rRNA (uracil(1498)-N(3))-methyltransferase [Proteobacteria bacterium]|nr:16S rRNA (uracil(1498)-N(3))-methyltransferase [Pseudomonadota bacterium]